MVKALVAYFSPTGTTAQIAERIAEAAEADLFEIVPEQPYTEAELDWHDNSSRSSLEMADEAARPAIATKVEDMGSYEVVYVGFPIWWYVEPRIIEHMQQLCPDAKVKGARIFRPTDDNAILYQWMAPFTH